MLNFQRTRDLLDKFNFGDLFIEQLGWSQPSRKKAVELEIENKKYQYQCIAEISGVAVFEVTATDGTIPEAKIRTAIHKEITNLIAENLLIFIDKKRIRSLWYWVKRERRRDVAGYVSDSIREHLYVKGQPGDLFLSKLGSLVIDITELEHGEPSVVEIAYKLQRGFDVEPVTKKFYKEFQEQHQQFLQFVKGIENENDRRWYTSVILNRLMFVYFLQRKGFIDNGDFEYLQHKLQQSKARGENLFYKELLQALFFESFAQPEPREQSVIDLVGNVKYLNGGLFLRHRIEQEYNISIVDEAFEQVLDLFARYSWNLDDTPAGKDDEINPDVLGYIFEKYINQKAFGAYYTKPQITEYLCDRTIHKLIVDRVNDALSSPPLPTSVRAGLANVSVNRQDIFLNPSLSIPHFDDISVRAGLANVSVNRQDISLNPPLLIPHFDDISVRAGLANVSVNRQDISLNPPLPIPHFDDISVRAGLANVSVNRQDISLNPSLSIPRFNDINELLIKLDANVCRLLIEDILPNLSILDPACGSGAFLVAAMKTLIQVYSAVIGSIKLTGDAKLKKKLEKIEKSHQSLSYYIKKRIVTDNLYGVDIMEEATEIAKLRLFLSLVSSAHDVDELEPLPNIDFNIMAGNSLIGLIRVNETAFDTVGNSLQGNLLQSLAADSYKKTLALKNKSIDLYKKHAFIPGEEQLPGGEIGTHQNTRLSSLRKHIDQLNRESQAKLNHLLLDEFSQRLGIKYEEIQLTGKSKKRVLKVDDIAALKPFHWGYHFDKVLENGGFDAIITNPPWEIFKPQAKEFFAQHNELVTKNKMDIKAFEKEQEKLLQMPKIADAWLKYQSQYPYVSAYFRSSEQYKNQISIVNGKKAGTDINLYKLFVEQCFNLLRTGAECGIVIPSGIYTDLGAKQLREMLFSQTKVTGLFCLENRKTIFEGVDSRFKIVVLTFEKDGTTAEFPSAFMRLDVQELQRFPSNDSLRISVDMVRKLSPDSLSVMEFKNEVDIRITEKMLKFPLLGEKIDDKWNLVLCNEFHMTNDSHLFKQQPGKGRLPLYEGKMIHQFTHQWGEPQYWIDEAEARKALLGKQQETGQKLNYQKYRLAFREIARNTDYRTLIASLLPKDVFANHKLFLSNLDKSTITAQELLYVCGVLNSLMFDFMARQRVTTSISMFIFYQLPIPRLTEGNEYFNDIVQRAAKLICTTPEFDELALETLNLTSLQCGVTDETERAKIRAELDGMIAHLYGLTEEEFAYILTTFPLVSDTVKQAALEAYYNFVPQLMAA